MRLADRGSAATLTEESAPRPKPGPGDVLINVHAAGVTPTELLWYPTAHTKSGEKRNCAIPGHEFSGTIAAVGGKVEGLRAGEEVYGMNDWFSDGAMAEYCITQPACIAPKPRKLTHAEAATVPIGALTAYQGLFDRARLRAGERVLVHGGAGAVGVFAVQLAKYRGARVITTASARNIDFLKQLGADEVIDYKSRPFEDAAGKVDIVFDTVGGDTLRRSWDLLNPQGRMVTIAGGENEGAEERATKAFFIVEPKREQLIEIAGLLDSGRLQAFVDAVLPFAQAPLAFEGSVAERRGRGKMVIAIAEEEKAATN